MRARTRLAFLMTPASGEGRSAEGCWLNVGFFRGCQATLARRNGAAVRARPRVPEERADAVCRFRREDVLESAGLFRDFFFIVHVEGLRKQGLRQAVATDYLFSTFPSTPGRGVPWL